MHVARGEASAHSRWMSAVTSRLVLDNWLGAMTLAFAVGEGAAVGGAAVGGAARVLAAEPVRAGVSTYPGTRTAFSSWPMSVGPP